MQFKKLSISGAWEVTPTRHHDDRGWFQEWFKYSELLARTGLDFVPVQANISRSKRGTIRGIHYSVAPMGQAKLVTVLSGEVDDYVIDVRPWSPTFGNWERVRLSSDNGISVLLASDLGHAFQALRDDSVVSYLVTAEYNPAAEKGITPLCDHLRVDWFDTTNVHLTDKDRDAPDLMTQLHEGNLPSI